MKAWRILYGSALIAAPSGACGARSELRVLPGVMMDAGRVDATDRGETDVARSLCGAIADARVPTALQGGFHLVDPTDAAINLGFASDGTVRWMYRVSDSGDAECGCWSIVGAMIVARPIPGESSLRWPTEAVVGAGIAAVTSIAIQPLGGGVLRASGVDTQSHVFFADDWLAGGVCLAPGVGDMAVPCADADPLFCP